MSNAWARQCVGSLEHQIEIEQRKFGCGPWRLLQVAIEHGVQIETLFLRGFDLDSAWLTVPALRGPASQPQHSAGNAARAWR